MPDHANAPCPTCGFSVEERIYWLGYGKSWFVAKPCGHLVVTSESGITSA